MAAKSDKKNQSILRQIIDWVRSLFPPNEKAYKPPTIIREELSPICRLLLLERDTPRAVRTWRCIPRYEGSYDILISCDTLEALPLLGREQNMSSPDIVSREKSPTFRGHIFATHRVSVLQIGRVPSGSGRISIKCLWMADLDLLGGPGMVLNTGNRYANAVVDGAAKLLLKYEYTKIDWNDVFLTIIEHYLGYRHEAFPESYGEYLKGFE